ncbi:MAG: hypothetical protein ABJA79_07130 [Parafilimonas sp.]
MQQEEHQLTEQESLELITRMINKAKSDYAETGISALMWGTVVTFCSLAVFAGYYMHWPNIDYVWFLTFIAVIPQIIISIRERKKRKFTTYSNDAMGGIWISFGITMFLLSYFTSEVHVENPTPLFLIVYGIPTFATGFTCRFKPMIIGGIACWIFSIICIYISFPYTMLLTASAAQLAWFIPGLILRKRYLKAKLQHV